MLPYHFGESQENFQKLERSKTYPDDTENGFTLVITESFIFLPLSRKTNILNLWLVSPLIENPWSIPTNLPRGPFGRTILLQPISEEKAPLWFATTNQPGQIDRDVYCLKYRPSPFLLHLQRTEKSVNKNPDGVYRKAMFLGDLGNTILRPIHGTRKFPGIGLLNRLGRSLRSTQSND